MKKPFAEFVSVALLVGILVGAMWFDRANNTAPLLDAVVERVIDGDTLDVLIDNRPVRLRLIGIDAPELSQANGRDVKQFLASLIEGKPVRVALENNDKYGRSLAEVFVTTMDPTSHQQSDTSVNAFLVRTGRAWAYRYQGEVQYSAYGDLEADARAKKRGLWVDSDAVEPWQWRKTQVNQ